MGPLSKVLRRALLQAAPAGPLTDTGLLERFVTHQDQAAFEEIVRRHGPMVFRVCQRVLGHTQDAEDAFQGAFVVLARRAAQVHGELLGGWLHGVACRVAWNARRRASRLRAREQSVAALEQFGRRAAAEDANHDVRAVLDEEINRLPAKYRLPVILCCLEGRTSEQTGQQLECQAGLVRMRLSRAYDLLRKRLARRGLALPAAGITTLLAEEATAAVPAALLASTTRGATLLAAGQAPAGAISAEASALADATTRVMTTSRLKLVAAIVMVLLVTGVGTSILVSRARSVEPGESPRVAGERQHGFILRGHSAPVFSVAISPDDRLLASASADKTVKLWDLASHKVLGSTAHPDEVYSVAFSPDGKTVASASKDGTVKLWDVVSGREFILSREASGTISVAFSPDGKWLAWGAKGGIVKLWDPAPAYLELQRLPAALGTVINQTEVRTIQTPSGVWCLEFSPDSKTLATGGWGGALKLWDANTGKELADLQGHTKGIRTVRFSRDGKTLSSAGDDRTAILWDVSQRQQIAVLRGHTDSVASVAFSPSGPLASASWDGTLKLWDLRSGKEEASLKLPSASAIVYTRDGRTVATGHGDGTVRLGCE